MPCRAFRGGRPCFFHLKSTLMRPVHLLPVSAAARTGRKEGRRMRRDWAGVQKRKGRRRQEVTILLSVVAPQRRQPPALPPFRAVPSALAGLTSLFGMGRGVAPPRRRRFVFPEPHKRDPVCRERELRNEETNVIGLLVRVGSVHRCTCTSRLSTW